MGKTGRPRDIDNWRERQYLDLNRRRLHIPKDSILWDMLSDNLQKLLFNQFPVGIYGALSQLGFTVRGTVVIMPDTIGGSKYGSCVYGANYGLYGTAKYGSSEYGLELVFGGDYGNATYGTTKFG